MSALTIDIDIDAIADAVVKKIGVQQAPKTETLPPAVIKQLAKELTVYIVPPVPVTLSYWSIAEIAACLGCSRRAAEAISVTPGFPEPYRFPSINGGKSHRKWQVKDILNWAETHKSREARL